MTSFFVFALGLAVGSFLNAVIYRMEKGESALRGRSYCPVCKQTLAWYDLVPLLSFVFLRGKCRYCKKPISWQYPAVEILTGAIFLLMTKSQIPMTDQILNPDAQFFSLLYFWIVASLLIIIFVYDLKYYLIPDIIVYSAILVSSIWYLVCSIFFHLYTKYYILNTLYSALGAAAFFFAIYVLSKGTWLGFGDVKLAFLMGLFLGFPNILVALYSAFFAGAVVGIVLIAAKKKKMTSQVPFGPFLIAGTFIALLWGQGIVHWYMRFLLV